MFGKNRSIQPLNKKKSQCFLKNDGKYIIVNKINEISICGYPVQERRILGISFYWKKGIRSIDIKDAQISSFSNLKLGIYEEVHKISVNINDFRNYYFNQFQI
jgi:hypothetical protein